MLQLKNRTRLATTLFSSPDADGVETLFAVIKGTFTIPRLEEAEKQTPIVMADRFHGDPLKASIAEPADIGLVKPGTDVLLFGYAYGPGGRPTTRAEVSLRVGPIEKRVIVLGDRRWGGPVLARISDPEPFDKMPLVWERAFGGTETLPGDPPRIDGDDRNPVGTGFRSRVSGRKLEGISLPNLEDPAKVISSPGDRPAPICFGAVASHWRPRQKYAGTYDEAWQRSRAPYLPRDFDPRFLQIAPEDQQTRGYLKGGEPVEVAGATPSGTLRFDLPARRVDVVFRLDSGEERKSANLDTIVLHPDRSHLVLVWRAALPCDKRLLKVREVEPIVTRAA